MSNQTRSSESQSSSSNGAAKSTVGQLFARFSEQISALIHAELELVKVQALSLARKVGSGVGALAVAGILALYALGFIFSAVSSALALAVPAWAASLIVGLLLALVAGVTAAVGIKLLKLSSDSVPDPSTNIKADIEAVKKGLKND